METTLFLFSPLAHSNVSRSTRHACSIRRGRKRPVLHSRLGRNRFRPWYSRARVNRRCHLRLRGRDCHSQWRFLRRLRQIFLRRNCGHRWKLVRNSVRCISGSDCLSGRFSLPIRRFELLFSCEWRHGLGRRQVLQIKCHNCRNSSRRDWSPLSILKPRNLFSEYLLCSKHRNKCILPWDRLCRQHRSMCRCHQWLHCTIERNLLLRLCLQEIGHNR